MIRHSTHTQVYSNSRPDSRPCDLPTRLAAANIVIPFFDAAGQGIIGTEYIRLHNSTHQIAKPVFMSRNRKKTIGITSKDKRLNAADTGVATHQPTEDVDADSDKEHDDEPKVIYTIVEVLNRSHQSCQTILERLSLLFLQLQHSTCVRRS